MLKNLTYVAVSFVGMAAASMATLPAPSFATTPSLEQQLSKIIEINKIQETATKEVAPEEKPKIKRLVCKGCNTYESKTLNFLQSNGVTDKYALATIMGNIRQESTFIPNICEGGARTSYRGCMSGGYGLLQWTDSARYNGLGRHADRIGLNPSSIDTQLDYLINEPDWKMIENRMKTPGGTIHDYMRLARKWIRWGHHGARTDYAYDYANRLQIEEVDS
jgi:hypothetical protein